MVLDAPDTDTATLGQQIWVLTGDKLETALEMGKLCRVVTSGMKEVILSASDREQMTTTLDKALGDTQVRRHRLDSMVCISNV